MYAVYHVWCQLYRCQPISLVGLQRHFFNAPSALLQLCAHVYHVNGTACTRESANALACIFKSAAATNYAKCTSRSTELPSPSSVVVVACMNIINYTFASFVCFCVSEFCLQHIHIVICSMLASTCKHLSADVRARIIVMWCARLCGAHTSNSC